MGEGKNETFATHAIGPRNSSACNKDSLAHFVEMYANRRKTCGNVSKDCILLECSPPLQANKIFYVYSRYLVSSLLGSNNSSKMSIRVCLVVSCNLEDQH